MGLFASCHLAGRARIGVSNPVEGVVALVVELRKERRGGRGATRNVSCKVTGEALAGRQCTL